jgi:putative FmdB family regulatory protein
MPFYEYECTACKFYVEALQKISDEPLKKCPSCKKPTLQKLVSAPVFRLKGGGWYETDFKSEKEEKRNIAGREEATEAGKAETKSEAGKETAKPAESKPAESKPVAEGKPAPKATGKAKSRSPARTGAKSRSKGKPAARKKARR